MTIFFYITCRIAEWVRREGNPWKEVYDEWKRLGGWKCYLKSQVLNRISRAHESSSNF
jgi:hypothetical protein